MVMYEDRSRTEAPEELREDRDPDEWVFSGGRWIYVGDEV